MSVRLVFLPTLYSLLLKSEFLPGGQRVQCGEVVLGSDDIIDT